MSAKLVFEFAPNVGVNEVARVVGEFFRVSVTVADNGPDGADFQTIPPHIKQAVETVGAEIIAEQDNPANGVETNPAVAFGGLMNGGNVNAASSVDAATSTTVQGVNPGTSATSVPASSLPVPPVANAAGARTESVAPSNPANVDKNGLPWDARIHSETPTLTDKGVWRKKRGATPQLVASVEAELRAALGNGVSAASAAPTSKTQSHGLPDNLVFADGNARKQAAVAHATAEAKAIAGPQIIDDAVLDGLLNGKQTTLSPQQMEWYEVFFAARNAKFTEFMNKATVQESKPVEVLQQGTYLAEGGVDATGLKWDARIHANPPMFDSAGVYVQRMDVAPETKLAIMAELRAVGNAVTTQSIPPAPVSAGSTTPVVETPPVAGPLSFVDMMRWIASNQIAGRITQAQTLEVAQMFGLSGIADANKNPSFNDAIVEVLKSYGAE